MTTDIFISKSCINLCCGFGPAAQAVSQTDSQVTLTMMNGRNCRRKVAGYVPHDVGDPGGFEVTIITEYLAINGTCTFWYKLHEVPTLLKKEIQMKNVGGGKLQDYACIYTLLLEVFFLLSSIDAKKAAQRTKRAREVFRCSVVHI